MTQLSIVVRPAEVSDAPAIHRLHTCSMQILCRSHYTPVQLARWLGCRQPAGYLPAIERHELFVATLATQIVGFGHALPGAIAAIFVDPAWLGKGIGRQLVQHGLRVAQDPTDRPVYLEATLNACSFYERCGFRCIEQKVMCRGDSELTVVAMVYHGPCQ